MTVMTITATERDALQGEILAGLSGIGDVWLAIAKKDYEDADRLGRAYSEDLRVILDDLGWAKGPTKGTVELTTPTDVLGRVLGRLCSTVESQIALQLDERAKAEKIEERNELVLSTCQQLLGRIGPIERPAVAEEPKARGPLSLRLIDACPWSGRKKGGNTSTDSGPERGNSQGFT